MPFIIMFVNRNTRITIVKVCKYGSLQAMQVCKPFSKEQDRWPVQIRDGGLKTHCWRILANQCIHLSQRYSRNFLCFHIKAIFIAFTLKLEFTLILSIIFFKFKVMLPPHNKKLNILCLIKNIQIKHVQKHLISNIC